MQYQNHTLFPVINIYMQELVYKMNFGFDIFVILFFIVKNINNLIKTVGLIEFNLDSLIIKHALLYDNKNII